MSTTLQNAGDTQQPYFLLSTPEKHEPTSITVCNSKPQETTYRFTVGECPLHSAGYLQSQEAWAAAKTKVVDPLGRPVSTGMAALQSIAQGKGRVAEHCTDSEIPSICVKTKHSHVLVPTHICCCKCRTTSGGAHAEPPRVVLSGEERLLVAGQGGTQLYLCYLNLVQEYICGTSLVAQWLRIRLPMQGTRVRALAREDPTCCGATKPVGHNY